MLLIDKLWSFNISLSYPFHPPELGAAKKNKKEDQVHQDQKDLNKEHQTLHSLLLDLVV